MKAGQSDQADLAGNLAYLCDLHHGNAPGPEGRPQPAILRWGSRIVIMPTRGNFVHTTKDPRRNRVSPFGMEFLPFPPQGAYSGAGGSPAGDRVGLSFGFRVIWFHPSNPRRASHDLLCVSAMGLPGEPRIVPHAFSVRRDVLARHGAAGFVQAIMGEVWAFKDELCRNALSGLPQYGPGLEYAKSVTVADLLGFLGRMNGKRPREMRLDTVFLSRANFMRMAARHDDRDGITTPHPDVLVTAGCTVVAGRGIPDDVAYFTSLKDGPTLVHGPTVIRCEKDRFDVEYYCDTLPAREGSTTDIPAGLAVRLVPVPAKGGAQEARSIPRRGIPLDRFFTMARTLHEMGEHAMALAVLERAPRAGRDGVRTCVLWEGILRSLGVDDDGLVASHNDLLVCADRLIESGFSGDELLDARVRAMFRLGLG